MRLLAVAPSGEMSGAERVLLRYLVHAREQGWQVICLVPPGRFADALTGAGIRTGALPSLAVPRGPHAWGAPRLAVRWLRAAARLRRPARDADAVVVNGTLALPAVRLARLRTPVAWLAHDVIWRRSWVRLVRACRAGLTECFAVSDAVARPLRELGLVTRLVRNGTEWPVPPAPGPDGPPVVGVNGMLTRWKGQDVLLDAVAGLGADVRVEVIGGRFARDLGFADELAARAARPDLAGRVALLGHVADPMARMRTWTIAVSPSVEPEAGSLAVLEAMSIGLPLVVTDHGGPPEVLGGAGLVVPPRNPDALAEAIARLLADHDLRRSCAAAGPAAIADGLRFQDAARAFLTAVSELAAARRTPSVDRPVPR